MDATEGPLLEERGHRQRTRSHSPTRECLVKPRKMPTDRVTMTRTTSNSLSSDSLTSTNIEVYEIKSVESSLSWDSAAHQYIILQDLTHGMQQPCILDLKMGTRQYGAGASQAKRESQIAKCAKTTSKTLGVRMCGMQLYLSNGDFELVDKHVGRTWSEETFKANFLQFLSYPIRSDLVTKLLRKLEDFSQAIEKTVAHRFFGSSLLVVYDRAAKDPHIGLRMIDFANTCETSALAPGECDPTRPDEGYLLGLRSLLTFLRMAAAEVSRL